MPLPFADFSSSSDGSNACRFSKLSIRNYKRKSTCRKRLIIIFQTSRMGRNLCLWYFAGDTIERRVVESLMRLDFGADRCRMIVSLELGLAMLHLEKFLSPEQYMGTSNQGRIGQQKKRDKLSLLYAVPKIQSASKPNCPYGC